MKKLLATIFSLGVVLSANAADYTTTPNTSIFNATRSTTSAPAADTNITEEVRAQLGGGWFSKGFDRVTFRVNDGTVFLQGTVPTSEDKVKLENAIRNIDGVRALNSQLSVQGGSTATTSNTSTINTPNTLNTPNSRSASTSFTDTKANKFPQDISATPADKALNMKIRDNVSNGYLWDSYETIRLNTANGNVTIEGTVDSISDQQKILDGVRKVDGVKNVTTNLNFTNAK